LSHRLIKFPAEKLIKPKFVLAGSENRTQDNRVEALALSKATLSTLVFLQRSMKYKYHDNYWLHPFVGLKIHFFNMEKMKTKTLVCL
jgi:hypothetical protein